MSSSFFYSQDHDCSCCAASLHPDLLSPSLISSSEDVSSIIDLYWKEDSHLETAEIKQSTTTTKARSPRPMPGARKTSNHSALSIRSTPSNPPSLLSSSASTMTSSTSSSLPSPTTSSFSRRFRLKKAISNLSLRRKPSDFDLAPRSAKSVDDRTPISQPLTPASNPAMDDKRACRIEDGIHPYDFFEASLNMSADYSVLEDGWLRLKTDAKFR